MYVDRVERHLVRPADSNYQACVRLCQSAKRLGNCAVYTLRHNLFDNQPFLRAGDLDKHLREKYESDYRDMPSAAAAQRQGQIIAEQFKAFAFASREYKEHPEKFSGKPRLPGYKRKYRTFVVGRNGYKIENGILTVTGGSKFGFKGIKVKCCENQPFNAKADKAVCGDLRICSLGHSFAVEITYRLEILANAVLPDRTNALSIDLGIDNFVSCISTRPGIKPFLIKGGSIKSINQWWNKRVAQLSSLGKYGHIADITLKRNNQINDFLHKASHAIIGYCKAFDLGTIIIGINPDWKQRYNLGKVNNQKFVQIPHKEFINKLRYKAEILGIKVIEREESYASRESSLDFDPIPKCFQKDEHCTFSGKRVKRGLYKSKNGFFINADINGAINTMRKELGNDEWLRAIIQANGGRVDRPVAIRNLHSKIDCAMLLKKGQRTLETSCVSLR